MSKVIYLDVETTGTNPGTHAVIQIAWIVEVDGQVVSEKTLLVRPFADAVVDQGAMEVHGISVARLFEEGVSQTEAVRTMIADWGRVIDKFNRNDKASMCAYNLRFDFDFLKVMWERTGEKFLGSYIHFGRWLDPLYLVSFAQHVGIMERTPNLRLETVAHALGVSEGAAHDALDDIRMTRAVFLALGKMIQEAGHV